MAIGLTRWRPLTPRQESSASTSTLPLCLSPYKTISSSRNRISSNHGIYKTIQSTCKFPLCDLIIPKCYYAHEITGRRSLTWLFLFVYTSLFQRDMNRVLLKADWDHILQEMYRVVRPGGVIEIIECGKHGFKTAVYM